MFIFQRIKVVIQVMFLITSMIFVSLVIAPQIHAKVQNKILSSDTYEDVPTWTVNDKWTYHEDMFINVTTGTIAGTTIHIRDDINFNIYSRTQYNFNGTNYDAYYLNESAINIGGTGNVMYSGMNIPITVDPATSKHNGYRYLKVSDLGLLHDNITLYLEVTYTFITTPERGWITINLDRNDYAQDPNRKDRSMETFDFPFHTSPNDLFWDNMIINTKGMLQYHFPTTLGNQDGTNDFNNNLMLNNENSAIGPIDINVGGTSYSSLESYRYAIGGNMQDNSWYNGTVGYLTREDIIKFPFSGSNIIDWYYKLTSFSHSILSKNITLKPSETWIGDPVNVSGILGTPSSQVTIFFPDFPSITPVNTTSDASGKFAATIYAPNATDNTPTLYDYSSIGVLAQTSNSDFIVKTLTLDRPTTLQGFTRDDIKAPVNNSKIEIIGQNYNTTSNNTGFYRINDIKLQGPYSIQASKMTYIPDTEHDLFNVSGGVLWQNFTLIPVPGNITGNVTDSVTGAPIVNVFINVTGITSGVKTDSLGHYLISDVPTRQHILNASQPYYAPKSFSVNISNGETLYLNFKMNPYTGNITGIVTDKATGLPISNVNITIQNLPISTNTDITGHYLLQNIPCLQHQIIAVNAHYQTKKTIINIPANKTLNYDFTMDLRTGNVTGAITDNITSLPIAGVKITILGTAFTTYSDKYGYYYLLNVSVEHCTIIATHPDYYKRNFTVDIPNGSTLVANFTMNPYLGNITGIVKDLATGLKVSGANVTAKSDITGKQTSVLTANDGSYYIVGLAPGNYTMTASKTGFSTDTESAMVIKFTNTTQDFIINSDTTHPVIVSATPIENAMDVSVYAAISITFSKSMNTTATLNAISISPEMIYDNIVWSLTNTKISFQHSAIFSPHTTYNVSVKTTAHDKNGNYLDNPKAWSFTTRSNPSILKTSPSNGANNVSVNTTMVVTFSTAMDKSSFSNAITITPLVKIDSLSWSVDNKTLTIRFNTSLDASTTYNVTISGRVKDFEGLNMGNSYTFSFTTASSSSVNNNSTADMFTYLAIAAIIIVVIVIILVLFIMKKRKQKPVTNQSN